MRLALSSQASEKGDSVPLLMPLDGSEEGWQKPRCRPDRFPSLIGQRELSSHSFLSYIFFLCLYWADEYRSFLSFRLLLIIDC